MRYSATTSNEAGAGTGISTTMGVVIVIIIVVVVAQGPHLHADFPAGLDDVFPDGGQDDHAAGGEDVVEAVLDLGAEEVDMGEGLGYELGEGLEGG